MVTRIVFFSIFLVIAILGMGCSSTESPLGPTAGAEVGPIPTGPAHLPDQLRGYWMARSATVDGVEMPVPEALGRDPNTVTEILGLVGVDEFYRIEYDSSLTSNHAESGATYIRGQLLVLEVRKVDGQPIDPYNVLSSWRSQGDSLTLISDISGKDVRVEYTRFDLYRSPYF